MVAEELFDVVDPDDRVVRQLPRSEVHRARLLHRAVHVFVFRSDGKLLLHLRSARKEEFPSVWTSSASGHVGAGETYDDSAPRELFEELGLKARLVPLQKFAAGPDTSYEFTVLYQAHSDAPIRVDSQEISEHRWLEPSAIAEWIARTPGDFSPAFRRLFSWFLQCGSKSGIWNAPSV